MRSSARSNACGCRGPGSIAKSSREAKSLLRNTRDNPRLAEVVRIAGGRVKAMRGAPGRGLGLAAHGSFEADGDAAFIAKALGDIARAKGLSQVASDADLSRERLYKALSGERNPTLGTVLRIVGALGLKLRAETVLDPDAADQRAPAPR